MSYAEHTGENPAVTVLKYSLAVLTAPMWLPVVSHLAVSRRDRRSFLVLMGVGSVVAGWVAVVATVEPLSEVLFTAAAMALVGAFGWFIEVTGIFKSL